MPYIKPQRRLELDPLVQPLLNSAWELQPGDLNYVITRIVHAVWAVDKAYYMGNALMGVCSCVAAEFYRTMLAPYEDTKRAENGDV